METKPPSDTPVEVSPALNGSLTVADLAKMNPVAVVGMGKAAIKDLGKRYRQIVGLKPGSSSIRSEAIEDEVMERLQLGEALASIMSDIHMPAISTWYNWMYQDEELHARYEWALAMGQRTLKDFTYDIALEGVFSSGDVARDRVTIEVINKNAAHRNRAEFGDRQQIDLTTGVRYVLNTDSDDFC